MKTIPKTLRVFWLKIDQNIFETELEQLPEHSEDGKNKYLKKTLNSINAFLLYLVKSFVGSWFKILRTLWYTNMKTFQNNLYLVLKKYLFSWHDPLPGVESSSSYQVLSGIMINYISSYNYIPIFIFIFNSNDEWNLN